MAWKAKIKAAVGLVSGIVPSQTGLLQCPCVVEGDRAPSGLVFKALVALEPLGPHHLPKVPHINMIVVGMGLEHSFGVISSLYE